MANKLYEEAYIQDIAVAIREKNKTSNTYLVSQMGDAIRAIEDGGGNSSLDLELSQSLISRTVTEITADHLAGMTQLGSYAFYGCSALASITIPTTITSIGASALRSCQSLTSLVMPDSVTQTGNYICYDCTNLQNVIISNKIKTIQTYSFAYCTSLKSITIPKSVTSMKTNAFYGCSNLTDMYMKPTTPPSLGASNIIPTTTTIHVPVGSGDTYKSATYWADYIIVEDSSIN